MSSESCVSLTSYKLTLLRLLICLLQLPLLVDFLRELDLEND